MWRMASLSCRYGPNGLERELILIHYILVSVFVFASVFLFVFVFMLSCGQGSEWTVEEMAPFPALYILYSPPFTGCLLEPGKNTQSTIHAIYDCILYRSLGARLYYSL